MSCGRRWKRLHQAIYVLAAFGVFHAFLQAKSRADTTVVLAGVFVWLMAWRLLPAQYRGHSGALLGLAAVAAAGDHCPRYPPDGAVGDRDSRRRSRLGGAVQTANDDTTTMIGR